MDIRKRLYLYPFTKATTRAGGNTYILNLRKHLGAYFKIVNTQTGLGLLDVLLKLSKTNVLYFNWIEDVADKKFGAMQIGLLHLIVRICKIADIRIVWFVHNNLSHKKQNLGLKKSVVRLLSKNADIVLTHSGEAQIQNVNQNIHVFDHPVDHYQPVAATEPYEYDLLIWGTVNPYKGVDAFLKYNCDATKLKQYKILVAGKFASPEYFQTLMRWEAPNISVQDKILSETELEDLFSKSRFVLFTYNSASVLSSAALCKTLVHGKTIIGPNVGAFKELGAIGLIHTYASFEDLEKNLNRLEPKEASTHFQLQLQQYIEQHSWPAFASFAANAINGSKKTALQHAL